MGTQRYEVLKEHGTPHTYKRGDTRELEPSDAAALVEAGALKAIDGDGKPDMSFKRETTPLNKREPAPDVKRKVPRDD